jgi:DNA-damage-inducible protein J
MMLLFCAQRDIKCAKGESIMSLTNINIRTDSEVKAKAQEIFAVLGLDMTTAANLFLRQMVRVNDIPFTLTTREPQAAKPFKQQHSRGCAKGNGSSPSNVAWKNSASTADSLSCGRLSPKTDSSSCLSQVNWKSNLRIFVPSLALKFLLSIYWDLSGFGG